LVYVLDTYDYIIRQDLCEMDSGICELLWVQINFLKARPRLFCVCYRPPNSVAGDLIKLETIFNVACAENNETIILGDFNLNCLNPDDRRRITQLEIAGTTQIISDITRPESGTIIDHIYVSHNNFIIDSGSIPCCLSDHNIVWCTRRHKNMFKATGASNWITYRSYKCFESEAFVQDLFAIGLGDCARIPGIHIDNAWNLWSTKFLSVLNAHAPIRRKKFKNNPPPWLNGDVIEAMHKRNLLHKKACKDKNNISLWSCFRKSRNVVRKLVRHARSNYYNNNICDSMRFSPKKAWSEVKKLLSNTAIKSPISILWKGVSCTSSHSIANAFNEHFANICRPLTDPDPSLASSSVTSASVSKFVMPPTSAEWVYNQLSSLPTNKAVGLDGISGFALKAGALAIANSLSELFNLSLSSGVYPDSFKKAKVSALHKSGDLSNPDNYRPISILSVVSKILERHVSDALVSHLDCNNLLHPLQSGFRQKHSCATSLLNLYDDLLSAADKKLYSGLLLVDFSKAFDRVHHTVLLSKLIALGVDNPWFKNYLSNRVQCVTHSGILSRQLPLLSGVPQGSVLGPLLFSCLINDLPSKFNSDTSCHMFADDSTIVVNGNSVKEIETRLSNAANACASWAATNCMLLNLKKTKVMLIKPFIRRAKLNCNDDINVQMNGINLQSVPSAKVLGIFISSTLTDVQLTVSNQCKKIDSATFLIRNSARYLKSKTVNLLCNAFVKPHFSYCCEVWGPLCNSSQIAQFDKRLKICNKLCKTSGLNWLSFVNNVSFHTCIMSHKCRINLCPTYLINKLVVNNNVTRTRANSRQDFFVPHVNTTFGLASFTSRGASIFNALPADLKTISTFSTIKKLIFVHYS
jgi:hypothetical protein